MAELKLEGCHVALVTPFTDDNKIDINAIKQLTEWQIENNISGIVACGTTGESVTLSDDEYQQALYQEQQEYNKMMQDREQDEYQEMLNILEEVAHWIGIDDAISFLESLKENECGIQQN